MGKFDCRKLSGELFCDFHFEICGDLTPDFAGKWRTKDVVVGTHQPPKFFEVEMEMHDYVHDLQERLNHIPENIDIQWLETLAFAEGRLLSIHPFIDFNGRVSRVFIDWLLRQLNLPDIDPTPNEGKETQLYLTALRAADQLNWQPLMKIWRKRLEKYSE